MAEINLGPGLKPLEQVGRPISRLSECVVDDGWEASLFAGYLAGSGATRVAIKYT